MCQRAQGLYLPPPSTARRWRLPLMLILVLLPLLTTALSSSSSSSTSNKAPSSQPPLSPKGRSLERLLKAQEDREIAKLEEAAQALLEAETLLDAHGVRRPRDRRVVFTPATSSPFVSRQDEKKREEEVVGGGPLSASSTSSSTTPAVDGRLLRDAYKAKQARVQELSQFRSRRHRKIQQRLKQIHQVSPTLAIRIKFPDGAQLTAHFHEEERVEDVLALIRQTLSLSPSLPPFTLLSLGSTNKHRTFGASYPASASLSLKACGLSAPAATLLLQWNVKNIKGKGKQEEELGIREESECVCTPSPPPKDTAAWVVPELLGREPGRREGGGEEERGGEEDVH